MNISDESWSCREWGVGTVMQTCCRCEEEEGGREGRREDRQAGGQAGLCSSDTHGTVGSSRGPRNQGGSQLNTVTSTTTTASINFSQC